MPPPVIFWILHLGDNRCEPAGKYDGNRKKSMSLSTIVALAAIALVMSAWFTRRFCDPDSVVYIPDHPNERSLHIRPVPRGGGLAIFIPIIVCGTTVAWFYSWSGLSSVALGIFLVAAVSFIDDRYSVSPLYRLTAHVTAAAVIIYNGLILQKLEVPGASLEWTYTAGVIFSLVFIVWLINLYNFMDGMDGLAGGMAVFGFGTFAMLGWIAGHEFFLAINMVIAASAAGFLVFNFPPARIFMGDLGSSTLGLLVAVLSLWGIKENIFPFWVAILVFSPFIVDATVTLVRRLLHRERIWQAHKTHYYQQLVQAGWGHRRTVLIEYGIMLGCGLTALWGINAAVVWQAVLLAGWTLFYVLFFFWVSRTVLSRK
jgi:UDP-N-acetylmuramyl pentapeptide phosphotransferase/UDP-N-acetylglucosamine-1-phosphate transferase